MEIKVVETKEEMKEEAEDDKNIAGYLKNNEVTGDFHNIISHNISGKNLAIADGDMSIYFLALGLA